MGDQLRTSTMRGVVPVVLGALVCGLTVGATPASAQTSYTQITSQATIAAFGGLADLARGLGADIPTQTVEEISLSADGRRKAVRSGNERKLYDLDGFMITIDEAEMTWERKTAAQIKEEMQQVMQYVGGGGGGGRTEPSDASEAPDFENMQASFDIQLLQRGTPREVNGFDGKPYVRVVSIKSSSQDQGHMPPGMDGDMHVVSELLVVPKSLVNLDPVRAFDREWAMLIGIPLAGGQDIASSMMNNPEMREFIEKAAAAELDDMEEVWNRTKLFMVPRDQDFDLDAALAENDENGDEANKNDADEKDSGGGGLFGALGRLGALAGQGGQQPSGGPGSATGQRGMGGATIEIKDVKEPCNELDTPGAEYREVSR